MFSAAAFCGSNLNTKVPLVAVDETQVIGIKIQGDDGSSQQLFLGSAVYEHSGRRDQAGDTAPQLGNLLVGMSSDKIPGVTDLKDSSLDSFQAMFQASDDPSSPASARRKKKKWYSRAWKAVKKAVKGLGRALRRANCWRKKNLCKCLGPHEECPALYTCPSCYSPECQYPTPITNKCNVCNNRGSCAAKGMGGPNSFPNRRQDASSNTSAVDSNATTASADDLSTIFTGTDPWTLVIGQPLVPRSTRHPPPQSRLSLPPFPPLSLPPPSNRPPYLPQPMLSPLTLAVLFPSLPICPPAPPRSPALQAAGR